MCGIAGLLARGGAFIEPLHLAAMAEALRHRGPDDEGYLLADSDGSLIEAFSGRDTVAEWASRLRPLPMATAMGARYAVGLAHRRLSILDVSAAGHGPMASPDRRLWLSYNGEVYNYVELRHELESLGHGFQGASDTEVVLRAYEQWGEACLARFNGMWAFTLADLRRRYLLCARDRLGVKPFYYWFNGQTFAFASEIRALLRLPFVGVAANDRMVWDFLALGALDHTDETFFADINALGAGQYLIVPFEGQPVRHTYWQLDSVSAEDAANRIVQQTDVDRVRDLVIDAVRLRLRSDVSVGFCLSGGLDSSSIVGVADRLLDEGSRPQVGTQLKVFHTAFDDPRIDEREYVRAVVERSRLTSFYVWPTSAEFVDDYERLLRHQEQPFGGPSVYAQYRVVGLARAAGVKVLLDGQGGDELFAGYHRHAGLHLAKLLQSGRLEAVRAALLANGVIAGRHALFEQALRTLPSTLAAQLLLWSSTDARLIDRDFGAAYHDRLKRFLAEMRATRSLAQMLAHDLTCHSLPRLLRYEDRNSMAFSLESRVPFADDPRLIECVFALPDAAKLGKGWSKYVLRQAMAGLLPESVRWRRRKLGFSAPEQAWAANLPASPLWDVLCATSSRYIDRRGLDRYIRTAGQRHMRATLLWRLLELVLWERSLTDRKYLDPPPMAVTVGERTGIAP
jgi:asparagine synthase (glutamine-hydrolysing)